MTTRDYVLSMTVGELLAVTRDSEAPNTLEQLENAIGLAVETLDRDEAEMVRPRRSVQEVRR